MKARKTAIPLIIVGDGGSGRRGEVDGNGLFD